MELIAIDASGTEPVVTDGVEHDEEVTYLLIKVKSTVLNTQLDDIQRRIDLNSSSPVIKSHMDAVGFDELLETLNTLRQS